MADPDNTGPCDQRNALIDAGTLLYEIRTVLEALSHGLKKLLTLPKAAPVRDELIILENFANHAVEATDSLDETVAGLLTSPSPETPQE